MITYSAYDLGENGDVDTYRGYRDDNHYIRVTCSGYFQYLTVSSQIQRPAGMRQDYQLLYVMQGRMQHRLENKLQTVEKGTLVLYPPQVPNEYIYDHHDRPEVFWVHFTGFGAEECIHRIGLGSGNRTCEIGYCDEYSDIFKKMISELQLQSVNFREFAAAHFLMLIAQIQRKQNMIITGAKDLRNEKIWKALDIMHQDPGNDLSVQQYAAECHMSVSWFIHTFRQLTGKSPLQYQAGLRIGKAKELLVNTSLSVGEVAAMLSYSDIFNFSKAFRKYTGTSPLQYRKNSQQL